MLVVISFRVFSPKLLFNKSSDLTEAVNLTAESFGSSFHTLKAMTYGRRAEFRYKNLDGSA